MLMLWCDVSWWQSGPGLPATLTQSHCQPPQSGLNNTTSISTSTITINNQPSIININHLQVMVCLCHIALIVFFNLNDKPITYTDFIGLYLTVWHHHVIWLQHCRNQPFKFLIKIPPPCFPIPIRPTELIKMWEEPPGLLWWRLARKIVKFIHFN